MIPENNSGAKPRPIHDHLIWSAQERAKTYAAKAKSGKFCIKATGFALMGTTLENWGVSPEVQ